MKAVRNHISYLAIIICSLLTPSALAQSTAAIQGTVTDPSGAVVPNARITVRNTSTGIERTTQTDESGIYQIAALPVGTYRIEAQVQGFGTQVANDLPLQVSQTAVQNFQLQLGGVTQQINVAAGAQLVETTTVPVGQVINQKTVQEIPLNGRHFVDLGLLIPGSATPPQNGLL